MYSNSVGAILVPILQQLDKQMENITEWRIVKYYIHQGNSIIRLAVELLDSKCHWMYRYLRIISLYESFSKKVVFFKRDFFKNKVLTN